MSSDKQVPGGPERAAQAATKPVKVPLDQFVLLPERYCHRDPAELKDPKRLEPLAASIAAEGLQTPVEFYRDAQGRPVITKGHRRISAQRRLADTKRPGFPPDMPVEAIEVSGASPQDLVVRSVLDNVNRQSYTQAERIRAAKTLHDEGVSPERAANALGTSPKTFSRVLLIAQHPWMFDLVNTNSVPMSYAPTLLEAAVKEKRLSEVEEDLAAWVVAKKRHIKELAKAKTKISPAQQLVKSYMPKPLVDHWVAQIRRHERLDAAVPKPKGVSIDPDTNKVSLKVPEIDMATTPLPELARLVGELETAKQVMVNYLKARHAVQGPQDVAREAVQRPGGLDYLRSEGLGDLADEVELGLMEEAEQAEGLTDEGSPESNEGA
jgi:hypothetical protein